MIIGQEQSLPSLLACVNAVAEQTCAEAVDDDPVRHGSPSLQVSISFFLFISIFPFLGQSVCVCCMCVCE